MEEEGWTSFAGWGPLSSWFLPLWTAGASGPSLSVPYCGCPVCSAAMPAAGLRCALPGVSAGHPTSHPALGGSEDLLTLRAFGASPAAFCGSWPPWQRRASPHSWPGGDAGSNQQKRRQEPAVPPGWVIRPGGRQLGVSPNPRLLFHSVFNFI